MEKEYRHFKKSLKKSSDFRKDCGYSYKDKAVVSYNYRVFGYRTDWRDILEMLEVAETSGDNLYNEYICEDQVVKPYLDIEWFDHHFPQLTMEDDQYYSTIILKDIKKSIRKLMKEEWDIELSIRSIRVKQCHRDISRQGFKRSFHIIVSPDDNSLVFLNNVECLYFAKKLKMYTQYPDVIDLSVYSKFRNLRLLGHCKDTERTNRFRPQEGIKMDIQTKLHYLATWTHRVYKVLATKEDLVTSSQNLGKGKEVDDSIIQTVLEKVLLVHPTAYYDRTDPNNFMHFNYDDRKEKCFFGKGLKHDRVGFFVKIDGEGDRDGNMRIGCHSAHCVDERGCKTIYLGNIYEKLQKNTNNDPVTFSENIYLDPFKAKELIEQRSIGLAQIFEEAYLKPVKRIKWTEGDKAAGIVYYWNGKIWQEDTFLYLNRIVSIQIPKVLKRTIMNIMNSDKVPSQKEDAGDTSTEAGTVYSMNTVTEDQQGLIKQASTLIRSLQDGTINSNILKFIRPAATDLYFDKLKNVHPERLSVSNGMVSLLDKTIRPAVPEDNITRHLELEYTDKIYGKNGENSVYYNEWDQFVKDITRSKNGEINLETYNYLRWVFGYSIQGIPRHKKFFIFWGPEGYNGKSILLNTISDVLEDYCVTMDKTIVMESKQKTSGSHSTELVRLENCRIGILSDTKENCCIDDGQIKQLTSITDKISVREIYGKQKEMRPSFVPIIATNYKIRVNLQDPSMYERLVLFPFWIRFLDNPQEAHHRKNDPKLSEKFIKDEYKKSILSWLIDCAEYYSRNPYLKLPDNLKEAKDEYRRDMNDYLEFIATCYDLLPENTNLEKKRASWIKKTDVAETFVLFCNERGIKYTAGKVQKELDKYLKSDKREKTAVYIGLERKD